jgi:hypothetical protein
MKTPESWRKFLAARCADGDHHFPDQRTQTHLVTKFHTIATNFSIQASLIHPRHPRVTNIIKKIKPSRINQTQRFINQAIHST